MELQKDETDVFEQILALLHVHPEIKKCEVLRAPVLSFPGLEIYPDQRKVFRDRHEIHLTTKEYRILLLLVTNRGHVLTYDNIWDKVWGDIPSGNESNTIGFHICNLREKLYQAAPNAPFTIRSVRKVGYCFEIQAEK